MELSALSPDRVTLAVIAKAPVPGRVKTRLCPPCTPQQAAAIAEAALSDTLDAVLAAGVGRRVVVLDGEVPAWMPSELDVIPQHGGGLDERLANAFDDLGGPTVLIGMDTPQVTAELLDEVVATMCAAGNDGVIGAANDGGYWVAGLRRPDPAAFVGVPMSESHTGEAQRARFAQLGLRIAEVAELTDLDTFDEALEIAALTAGPRLPAAVRAAAATRTRN